MPIYPRCPRRSGFCNLLGTALIVVAIGVPGVRSPACAEEHADSTEVRHTNRLIDSNDPYLLLHAHNPVDWYPWGPEALEKAKREQKPIFLSVGYSTCYWCHVAEETIYSRQEFADLMNAWFVNIKVDREQRPDIDRLYMAATQAMTGRGGWPNNVFLTPISNLFSPEATFLRMTMRSAGRDSTASSSRSTRPGRKTRSVWSKRRKI